MEEQQVSTPVPEASQNKMKTFYESGLFCDLIIKLRDGRTMRVHKALVCAYSEVLEKACASIFREANTGVIEISHDDSKTVEFMMNWMYSGNISPAFKTAKPLIFHVRIYVAADFYQVPSLKEAAAQSLCDQLPKRKLPPADEEFPAAIELIYSSTPSSERLIRNAILCHCIALYNKGLQNSCFMAIETADFWKNLCKQMYDTKEKNLITFSEYSCKECDSVYYMKPSEERPQTCPMCCGFIDGKPKRHGNRS
ncbi:BTB/POZ protein [Phyllosticta citriasiana]|uniref:BTB/POZ protein n=1 Tax=Phyllosticta citriasiana TaxID=595635 RepID=UPI0030FD4141